MIYLYIGKIYHFPDLTVAAAKQEQIRIPLEHKRKDRKIFKVSINPFMRASNDFEAIQSKFLGNSISVKFSLKTCLCSTLIVVYINKDQILCSASERGENI